MNLPSNKEPPLPNPLLHKSVEERGMERREGFVGSMWECVRKDFTALESQRRAARDILSYRQRGRAAKIPRCGRTDASSPCRAGTWGPGRANRQRAGRAAFGRK